MLSFNVRPSIENSHFMKIIYKMFVKWHKNTLLSIFLHGGSILNMFMILWWAKHFKKYIWKQNWKFGEKMPAWTSKSKKYCKISQKATSDRNEKLHFLKLCYVYYSKPQTCFPGRGGSSENSNLKNVHLFHFQDFFSIFPYIII